MDEDKIDVEEYRKFHGRYNRMITTLKNFYKNEEILIQRDELMQLKLASCNAQLAEIREAVKEKMNKLYEVYQEKLAAFEAEKKSLMAQLRKADLKIEMLENKGKQKPE